MSGWLVVETDKQKSKANMWHVTCGERGSNRSIERVETDSPDDNEVRNKSSRGEDGEEGERGDRGEIPAVHERSGRGLGQVSNSRLPSYAYDYTFDD